MFFSQISKKKLLHLLTSLSIPLLFVSISPPVGRASGSDFLLDQNCVSENMGESEFEVSIAREFYTSIFYIGTHDIDESGYITCSVSPSEYNTLSLQFGMVASSRARSRRVSVWLDDSETEVVNVFPDEVENLLIDISGIRNIHIEVSCIRACGPRVISSRIRFMEADLQ